MDDVAEVVLAYIRWETRNPLPAGVATVAVLADLRGRLDAACPEWRWDVYADAERAFGALEVEFHFVGGAEVRGSLVQRPSPVVGDSP